MDIVSVLGLCILATFTIFIIMSIIRASYVCYCDKRDINIKLIICDELRNRNYACVIKCNPDKQETLNDDILTRINGIEDEFPRVYRKIERLGIKCDPENQKEGKDE